MQCVIIILTSAIAAKLLFERYKYSFILLLFRAFTVILSHYCYKYVLFPQTNGLDFVYNDELFFIAQLENIKNIHWNSVLFQLGTSNFYVFFLNIFKRIDMCCG